MNKLEIIDHIARSADISKAAASEYINQLAADRKEAHGGA